MGSISIVGHFIIIDFQNETKTSKKWRHTKNSETVLETFHILNFSELFFCVIKMSWINDKTLNRKTQEQVGMWIILSHKYFHSYNYFSCKRKFFFEKNVSQKTPKWNAGDNETLNLSLLLSFLHRLKARGDLLNTVVIFKNPRNLRRKILPITNFWIPEKEDFDKITKEMWHAKTIRKVEILWTFILKKILHRFCNVKSMLLFPYFMSKKKHFIYLNITFKIKMKTLTTYVIYFVHSSQEIKNN